MTEGVVRSPSLFSITRGLPPSMMATQEFVVPRSMPITLAIGLLRKKAFCVRLAALVGCLPLPIQVEAIAKKREVRTWTAPPAAAAQPLALETITRAGRSN